MKTTVYNKLVRDKIPQIIEGKGARPFIEVLEHTRYVELLDEKLEEEFKEYTQSKDIEELADIVEVIYAILDAKGVSIDEFEKLRKTKAEKRGAFKERLFLKEVIE